MTMARSPARSASSPARRPPVDGLDGHGLLGEGVGQHGGAGGDDLDVAGQQAVQAAGAPTA